MAEKLFHGLHRYEPSSVEGRWILRENGGNSVHTLEDRSGGSSFEIGEQIYIEGELSPIGIFYGHFSDENSLFICIKSGADIYTLSALEVPGIPVSILDSEIEKTSLVVEHPLCFLAGTLMSTPDGERCVEDLTIGDVVLTEDGRTIRVKWVGRQTIATGFGPLESRWPVLIRQDALADHVPCRDLRVTSDHALLIDGILVQAGALVGGSNIRRLTAAELGARYTVFHLETENHEVIIADGVAAETFVDNVTRRRFDNYAEYEALYGPTGPSIAEKALPRVKSARQLPTAIRWRLWQRAGERPSAATAVA